MRVLFVSNCYPPHFIGGAELVVHRHATRMAQLGHDVQVFAGDHSAERPALDCWREDYEGISVTRIRITVRETHHTRTNFLNPTVAQTLHVLLREQRPDVVHFHNTTGLSLASYHHCAQLGIPTVVTLHDHWGFCLRNTLITVDNQLCTDRSRCERCLPLIDAARPMPVSCRKDYMRRRFATVTRFITPSAYLATQYVATGFPPDRFHVVSNGIDPAPARPQSAASRPCRFTTICYLGEHKGVHVILKALAALPRNLPWECNIVGVGHLEPTLRRLARIAGLEHRIRFLGRLPNREIARVLESTDVYILASVWAENEPVSILEALSHGVPVIATNMGGVSELVWPGINGWLVPPANVAALRDVLREAACNPDQVRRLSAGAVRTGSRWPEHRQVERLLGIYEEAIRAPALTATAPLVAISGRTMPPSAVTALGRLKAAHPEVDFIPLEWLEEDELAAAGVILQADATAVDSMPGEIPRVSLAGTFSSDDLEDYLGRPVRAAGFREAAMREAVFAKE